jgi:2-hydroxy-3-keto-5-methylthiopentenyl-1-phosphate phosphatase
MKPKTRYFVDFDHTISKRDVWNTLLIASNPDGWREIVDSYINDKISSRECNLLLAKSVTLSEDEAHDIVRDIGIDPTFHNFVDWTKQHESPLMILSDGYQFYIELLLKQEGLDHIPYFSNQMTWTDQGIQVEFPLYKEDCERDMAHCKCQHVRESNGYRRIYVGDGVSDSCAAEKCDFVYAKLNLLDYCRENNIAHKPFDNFQEIIDFEETYFAEVSNGVLA